MTMALKVLAGNEQECTKANFLAKLLIDYLLLFFKVSINLGLDCQQNL